jgi:hypothetical protein
MSDNTTTTIPDQSVKVGRGTYDVRCLECKEGNSSKGKRQFVQVFEIFGHANPALNGRKVKFWQSMEPQSEFFINVQRKALGLPPVGVSEIPTIRDNEYVGTEAKVVLSQTDTKELDETGQPLADPYTGKAYVNSVVNIDKWWERRS